MRGGREANHDASHYDSREISKILDEDIATDKVGDEQDVSVARDL
jgi:hypothetical protein